MAMLFDVPEVIGHRGAGRGNGSTGDVRENTPESFQTAVRQGADWIELDVHRSAEGTLFLHHDGALPDGRAIVRLADDDCRAAGLFTLDEGLEAIPADFPLNIEVKSVMEDASDSPERRTVALALPYLAREARRRRLFPSSFDPGVVLAVRTALPHLTVGWMAWVRGPLDLVVPGAAGLGCSAVGVDYRSLGLPDGPVPAHRGISDVLEIAHDAGMQAYAWNPDPASAAALVRAGFDAVCVDDVPGTLDELRATPDAT
ncbi:glycerophosphodiester phosphodiesterase [Spiractinospora alimapuensis]|nr:glycerophosphodiester phosphodiesterase [Spiractinospora alimapuensis]QVQ54867.1 glycerophosphodiester phosphodiesterase [Spiractinospora alimapuensis]